MSDTQTAAAPEAPSNAPVSDKEFDNYFATRGGEDAAPEADAPEAPEATAAPVERPIDAAKPATEPSGEKVPLAVLLEERRQRQATQAEMAALKAEIDALKNPKPVDTGATIPSIDEDPIGHFKGLLAQQAAELKAFKEGQQQDLQQRQAQAEHQALIQDFISKERAIVERVPDYFQATKYLADSRTAELRALGWNQQQIAQDMAENVTRLGIMARQSGRDPAELTYEIAKSRGYAPQTQDSQQKASIEEEKLLNAERGQKLGGVAGGNAPSRAGQMTAEKLAAMPAAKFDAWCEANPDEAMRLMGG